MLAPKMNTVDAISAFAATSRRSATLCSASLHSPPTVSSGCSAPDFTSTPPDLSVSGQTIRRFRISARGSDDNTSGAFIGAGGGIISVIGTNIGFTAYSEQVNVSSGETFSFAGNGDNF